MGKLLLFAQRYKEKQLNAIVQKDKASSHAHSSQQKIYSKFYIFQLLWPGNLPDLNAIEPAWPYLKQMTTQYSPPTSFAEASFRWLTAWESLEQSQIQAWIEQFLDTSKKLFNLKEEMNIERGGVFDYHEL